MQEAEHDTEERVHRYFVGEDTRARHEWLPRPASPIGVDPIEQGHCRPQDDILKLRGYETLPPASSAHPAEDCSEGAPFARCTTMPTLRQGPLEVNSAPRRRTSEYDVRKTR
jgi:hypothetical protein